MHEPSINRSSISDLYEKLNSLQTDLTLKTISIPSVNNSIISNKHKNMQRINDNNITFFVMNNETETVVDISNFIKTNIKNNDNDLFGLVDGDIALTQPVTPADVATKIKQGTLCTYNIDEIYYIYKTWSVINLNTNTNWKAIVSRISQTNMFSPIKKDIRWTSYNNSLNNNIDINKFIKQNCYNVAITTRIVNDHWVFDLIPANKIIGYVKYAIPADKAALVK